LLISKKFKNKREKYLKTDFTAAWRFISS